MVSQADKEIAAQVLLTPGGTRTRPRGELIVEQALTLTGKESDDGPAAEVKQPTTPRSAKRKGFSHADSEIATQVPTTPGRTRAQAREAAPNVQQAALPSAAAPHQGPGSQALESVSSRSQGSSSASSGPSSKGSQASGNSSSGALAPSAAPSGPLPSGSPAWSPGPAVSQPLPAENQADGEGSRKVLERRRPSPISVGGSTPSLPDMPNRSETSGAPSKEGSQTRANRRSLGGLIMSGAQNLRIDGQGKRDASRTGALPPSDVSMRDVSSDTSRTGALPPSDVSMRDVSSDRSRRNMSPAGALPPSDVSLQDVHGPIAQADTRRSRWDSWLETRQPETLKSAEKEQWHDADEGHPTQKHGPGNDQAQTEQAQGDEAHLAPQDGDSDSDDDDDDDDRFVDFQDPETRDEFGNFDSLKALIVGRLSWRGRMIVQLPSNNPRYPGFPRRYTVVSSHYKVQWKQLRSIAHRDLIKFKRLKEDGVWRPKLLGVTSSPVYVNEPQANPFHHLLLQLPDGSEWHSKSDTEAVWGGYEDRMQKYWDKSGQHYPLKPRPAEERARLQELAVDYLQAETTRRGQNPARE